MAISRTDAAAYLESQFDKLRAEVKYAASNDTANGYGPDIDAALRKLGYSQSEVATAVVDDSKASDYFALLDYYALLRFGRKLATKVDIAAADQYGIQNPRSEVFRNVVRDLLKTAKATAEALGYDVEADTSKRPALFKVY